ncbi:TonB-dependent receptor plug domain-containing protein [Porticoccus sp.]|nr:MAG: TonB-dependent receptor [Gammaproteobacteria bacterium]
MNKAVLVGLLAISFTAAVQASESSSQLLELPEIVVTASLTPVQLLQTGSSVTVISSSEIEKSHIAVVSDLLRNVPGVAINRSGVLGSTTQLRMRGSEGNHVLVLLDGMEVSDGSQGDEFNWAHMPAMGIERIEVVSGAQSVMWGSNAVGGVINIITRQATSGSQGDVFAEFGNHGTTNSGFSLGGRSETAHFNLRASHLASEGENISRHGGEEDGYRNTTLNLNAGWSPLGSLSFSLHGRQTEGENEFDAGDPPSDANNESEIRQRFVRAQADLSLLDDRWQHRVAVAVSRHGNENFTDGLLVGSSSSRKKQYSYLTSYSWNDQNQRLSLLVERETEQFSQRGPVLPWGDPNQDRVRETNAVALEYRVVLWEDLTLGASLRHDDNTEFDDAYTRRFDASYLISDTGTRLRATWGTAVKNPTFSERYGYFTSFVGNLDLKPEKSTSWDVGIDQSLFNERLQLGLTYFKARLEDEINGFVFDPTIPPSGGYTAENVSGTSDREGVEISAKAALSSTVTLKGSFTYTDATEPDGSGRDVDEHRRPHKLGSATLQWDPGSKWSLELNAQYNGHQDDSDFSLYPAPVVRLDSYTLLNLSASFHATNQLTIYGRFENILDDDYEEIFGYQSLGFGAMVGIRYSFAQ